MSSNIRFTSKVIFESHDLHFVTLLKVVCSDTNSIVLKSADLLLYPEISRFKGQDTFVSYFEDFKLLFDTNQKIDFLKISNCPDPFNTKSTLRFFEVPQVPNRRSASCITLTYLAFYHLIIFYVESRHWRSRIDLSKNLRSPLARV